MGEREPRLVHKDFWSYWQSRFIDAGYDPEYIKEEMNLYKEHAKNEDVWPEGENHAKRVIQVVFKGILDGEGETGV